ncbi:MAG: bifunctional prephenate dehydrogenase/3-phosphoshikimate 1-carboxyvinyltransferase [Proteobacteria bacterium]|nr:bifunctional prephenate dehydrogenase/3-phosphoshikimate 1-carboxyvinyltransferase [Pseudomonadota bacterium]MDA1290732.1 bifunctional prephenate dehydrogenase/3-phosphoshikimate 1-carboxyvinyltransferase [Pseudomonadota bacterium]
MNNKVVLIVGLGMIGGSIARGLKKANPKRQIIACDTDIQALQQAVDDGVVSRSGELATLCPLADIIILAVPPLTVCELLPEILNCMAPSSLITDVASVKSHIFTSSEKFTEQELANFVPAHPIAGSEKSGYAAAVDDLFEQRNVILTPHAGNSTDSVAAINALWRELGANVLGMTRVRHDEVLAATSHLPHLLAYAIVDVLLKQEQSEDIFRYAAGGFADFSRLASSDARMWSDIFVANSAAVEKVLDDYIQSLLDFKTAIKKHEHEKLEKSFGAAKQARENFITQHFKPKKQEEMISNQLSFSVQPGGQVAGSIRVAGDKSISHRSIILASIANGITRVTGFLEGEDALNTVAAFREMGVTIVGPENGELTIYGVGKNGLQAPRKPLYMGNSGTAMRLLAGLLAAQSFDSELTGDESLTERPMNRVAQPLRSMGANIDTGESGTPPLAIRGSKLKGITYEMPIASAQVKSCLLLAGLYAEGETKTIEPAPCRDHTERMLQGFGYEVVIDEEEGSSAVIGGADLKATQIDVPGDISSAAFFLVAAAITPGSDLTLQHVGVNPTRIGIINLLRDMGANIESSNERLVGGEPVADLRIRYRQLKGIVISEAQIPLAIDEFPVLFVAAACAEGETLLRGAKELRVKESDRLDAMAQGLNILGVAVETFDDGIKITGGQMGGGAINSFGDHRIAMAFTVAGLRSESSIDIANCANVATSFPNFVELASEVGMRVSAQKSLKATS